MGLSRTLAPIVAVLIAAGPLGLAASAQDNMPPKVKTLTPTEGPAGSVVLAKGLNFSDKREDVQVLAGSAHCLVLAVGLEEVRFIVPAMPKPPPGNLEIHIRIKDRDAGNAVFKIIEKKAKDRVADEGKQQKYEGTGGPEGDPFKENEKFLNIKKVTIVTGPKGENPSCVVEGESALPKDFSISVNFGFAGVEEKQIAATKHAIEGPTWKVTFGPYTGKLLLAGNYYIHAEFNLAKQSALDMGRAGWPARLSESERAARSVITARKLVVVGTDEDRRKQDAEINGHYSDLANQTTILLDNVDRAYCSAGKAYFRKPAGGGIDEDAWAKWVKSRGMGQTDDDLKKLNADVRFLSATFFNAVAWQTWMETDVYKRLTDVYKRHLIMRAKYVGTRDERVQVEGDDLCAITLGLAQRYTADIYAPNKLVVPESLKNPPDLSGMDASVMISRPSFEAHRKLLLERLRVPTFDPGKPPEAPKKADSAPPPTPVATPAKPEAAPVTSPAPVKVEAPAPPPAQANPAPAEEPKTQPPKDAPKEGPR